MTVTSVNVAYRPVRVGCLVREGVIDDVVAAAALNTMAWGGMFNPLIPVGRTSKPLVPTLSGLGSTPFTQSGRATRSRQSSNATDIFVSHLPAPTRRSPFVGNSSAS